MQDSQVIYLRIKEHYLKQIDELIKTRIYKDRPHFLEVAILKELRSYDPRN